MAYAIVNGIRIRYEVAGAGDAVLLVNGLGAPAVSWALQVDALAPHFRVVTFDNRGVGESDLPPDPVYATAQMADDEAALLRQLKIDRAHVVGASMGGTIAQELALRHPRLVRSLVLACTWADADARFLHTIEAWASLAYRVPAEERFRFLFYPGFTAPDSSRRSRTWRRPSSAPWGIRTRRSRRRSSDRPVASSPGTAPA